jgi:hypothetical protein
VSSSTTQTGFSIVQLRRGGTATFATSAIVDVRAEYARRACLRLVRLLEPALWEYLQKELLRARFEEQTYDGVGSELAMLPGVVDWVLNLVANDPDFLALVRQITECSAIRGFSGRVYRLIPEQAHGTTWHNDMGGPRLVAMSVNLSLEHYVGGTLQLRDSQSHEVLCETENTGKGDAVLFRIGSDLQHRVTPVTGSVPKTAFAGWFGSTESLAALRPHRERLVD